MSVNSALQNTAIRTINRYGKTAILRRTTPGVFDPITGTYGPGAVMDYPIKASPPAAYRQDLIDGTLVQQDDFQVQIAAKGLAIVPDVSDSATNDAFVMDEQAYSIVTVWPVYGGEQPVMYRLQVRQ